MDARVQIDAEKLRVARRAAGLKSPYDVMRGTSNGISVPAYTHWESTTRAPLIRFDYNLILAVCKLLNVCPDDVTSLYVPVE